jgi:hypothetical protein
MPVSKSKLLLKSLASLVLLAQNVYSQNLNEKNNRLSMSYEAQLVQLLKEGLSAERYPHSEDRENFVQANPVLQQFIEKFDKHEMALLNVVFRDDHKTIRITWADKNDNFVVKQTYQTATDPVLESSRYADKRNTADTKIMYRYKPNEAYKYIQVIDLQGQDGQKIKHTDSNPTEQRCNFCHTLVKPANATNGVFFKRYQEENIGIDASGKTGTFFNIANFNKINNDSELARNLPKMSEPFYYRLANIGEESDKSLIEENARVLRTLIEIPHLLEVYAVDNSKSICIGIDFGRLSVNGFGREDYICADNKNKTLSYKFTNSIFYKTIDPVIVSEPYIDYKKLAKIK